MNTKSYNQLIVEVIPDLIIIYNQEGVYLELIASADNKLYAAKNEMIGKKITEVLPAETAALALEGIKNALQTGMLQTFEYRLTVPAGNLWFEARMLPAGDTEVIALIRDVTELKNAEEKLHQYTMELELREIELEGLYHKLDAEIDKARYIHERTLPVEKPCLAGINLASYYQPAQKLGGDFYNMIHADDKLVFYLSDVSGHGLEGTLLSAFVKEAIDSYISLKPQELSPEKILNHLNRQYRQENYPDDYFVCIYLAVLDYNTMELHYTGAGFQELPLVQMGNGKKMRLHTEGPPISSAIPEEIMDFTTGKIILSPGTTVLVNTDGITEQQAGEEQYNGRLEQVFYEHSHLLPELIMNAIKEDFYRFNGGLMQGDDDITLGIIQVEPKEKRELYLELESNINELSTMRQAVSGFMPGTETAELFLMGLHELATNAIEHGNKFDPQKKVKVKISVAGKYFSASIQDEGPGFDWIQQKDKPLVLDAESERGRGIAMIQVCVGKLYYNEKGNRAFLVVDLS